MIGKRVRIVDGMTGQQNLMELEPGVTTEEILDTLGLKDYRLARVRGRQRLWPGCDVSRTVENGERLFVFSPMEIGGGKWPA